MVALYIHWPFCRSKCPYCDFNSHVRETIPQSRWRDALLAELDRAAGAYRETHPGARLETLFFGGGTPSLMAPETVAALIERAGQLLPTSEDVEITLEANPTSVEAERFRAYRDAGVNRVSLGVQSLDNDALRFLGREHSADEARAAVAIARDVFPRHSIDLIYARTGQTEAAWRQELEEAVTLAGDHISLYQLTLEPGTAFTTRARKGEALTADEDTGADLFDFTQEILEAAGYPAYETSNHARPGGESQHNLVYWRYGDYLGIGPGAHGRVSDGNGGKHATRRLRLPEKWLGAVEREGHGLEESTPIDLERRAQELLMMGLRLAEGVPEARLRAETGCGFDQLSDDRLMALEEEGLVTFVSDGNDRRLAVTKEGHARLDAILGYLLA